MHFKHGQTKLMRNKTAYRFPRSSCINIYLNDVKSKHAIVITMNLAVLVSHCAVKSLFVNQV